MNITNLLRVSLLAAAAGGLAGCEVSRSILDSTQAIRGAGTMRVDVEVYKGPLSKDPWTQFAELLGIINDFAEVLNRYRRGLCGASGERYKNLCTYFDGTMEYLNSKEVLRATVLLPVLRTPAENEKIAEDTRRFLAEVVEISAKMKMHVLHTQGGHVASPDTERTSRMHEVFLSTTFAEYSNQMASRADALLQQMNRVDRRELPLSIQLRDTSPTDFFNLYVWNKAAFANPDDLIGLTIGKLEPVGNLFIGDESIRDRVRGMERLYADHNWSRINTVYASGQGDVSMAFIKDDIGNWNLKSFDNDPTELLQGYFGIAKAALATATSIAQGAASGGSTAVAGQLIDLSNRIAFGQSGSTVGPTAGGLDAAALHQRAVARLIALQQQMQTRPTELGQQISTLNAQILAMPASGTPAERLRRATAEDRLAQLEFERDNLPTIALNQARAILREHGAIVDVLQESVASPNVPINLSAPGPIPPTPPRALPNPPQP